LQQSTNDTPDSDNKRHAKLELDSLVDFGQKLSGDSPDFFSVLGWHIREETSESVHGHFRAAEMQLSRALHTTGRESWTLKKNVSGVFSRGSMSVGAKHFNTRGAAIVVNQLEFALTVAEMVPIEPNTGAQRGNVAHVLHHVSCWRRSVNEVRSKT